MKITLQNTPSILVLNGVPARVWVGETDTGMKVEALICILKPARGENPEELDEELTRLRRVAALMRDSKEKKAKCASPRGASTIDASSEALP